LILPYIRSLNEAKVAMNAKPLTVVLGCLGCCLFPCIVMIMTLTYEQKGDEPGPFPYSAVDYVFYADLCYTAILIWLLKGWRIGAALISIPLLAVTAVMVVDAGMWFSGNYL
jgi:hypothetical protein